jgi:hypothetical protein
MVEKARYLTEPVGILVLAVAAGVLTITLMLPVLFSTPAL